MAKKGQNTPGGWGAETVLLFIVLIFRGVSLCEFCNFRLSNDVLVKKRGTILKNIYISVDIYLDIYVRRTKSLFFMIWILLHYHITWYEVTLW